MTATCWINSTRNPIRIKKNKPTMAANIYLYGYGEDATPLVSCKQQKQEKQDGVDKAQDARMDKIDEVNKQQTEKLTENDVIHQTHTDGIAENKRVNDDQEEKIAANTQTNADQTSLIKELQNDIKAIINGEKSLTLDGGHV